MKQGRTDRDWAVVAVMTFAAGAVLTWALMSKPSPKSATLALDWPAWVQAIGSIAAIIAAGLIPLARQSQETGGHTVPHRADFLCAISSDTDAGAVRGRIRRPRLILAHLTQLHKAFDSVNYVDVPNRSLAIALQQSATAVSAPRRSRNSF
jgi:hypothetical protein